MHQKYHPRYPVKREFGNLPKCITNQSEIPSCVVIVIVVNTIKTFPFSIYRFTNVSKAWGIEPKDFDTILNKYIEDTTEKGSSDGFTGQLTNIRHNMDSREQFEMLSTVSNYHPLGFPSTQDPQKIKTPNISFHEHIATPEMQRYIPTSPRNRIIYFIKSGELRHLKNYLKFLQLKDNIPEFQTDEPPHKEQRLTGRARRVNAFHLKQKYFSLELADMIRQSNIDRSVGVSRGYTDYHQGRAIHMADSRIH